MKQTPISELECFKLKKGIPFTVSVMVWITEGLDPSRLAPYSHNIIQNVGLIPISTKYPWNTIKFELPRDAKYLDNIIFEVPKSCEHKPMSGVKKYMDCVDVTSETRLEMGNKVYIAYKVKK